MLRQKTFIIAALAFGIFLSVPAGAHTPLCSCYDNGDATITCEGGFSDGSSAAGVELRVEDQNGQVLIKGKMDADSEFTFDRPAGAFKVLFDAGPGHLVEINGNDITE